MATDGARYSTGDLAGLAGATARTIRYYVAQGLLPPPVGVGPGAHYTDDHLGRLRLIRRLQRQHQPLSEIRQRLASLGEQDVADLVAADVAEEAAPPADSALEYLRSVLAERDRTATPGRAAPAPPQATSGPPPVSPAPASMQAPSAVVGPARLLRAFAAPRLVMHDATTEKAPAPASAPAPEPASAPAATTTPETPEPEPPASEQRSQWDRIGLTPNIEIHVRRPLGRLENRRVERLITIARQLLREEQP